MSRRDSFSASGSKAGAPFMRATRAAAAAAVSLVLASCAGIETVAPPAAKLAARGRDTAQLEAGRVVYLENCTRCHTPEPVRKYTAAQWPGIIAEMADQTKLTPEQHRAVLAYVLAATTTRAP